ncbi:MAG: NFACT family protein [Fimbriimonadaceae bacterium]|nr:NFACT family protein [Fimbriimonadaceae bacterium]
MRIPFDSLCLTAVVTELQQWIGARVQGVRQPDSLTLVIGLYAGKEVGLLLSADAEYARAHLVNRRPGKMAEPPAFGLEVRRRIDGARLVSAKQWGLDRVLDLVFEGAEGRYAFIAELMGKHSNLILVGEDGKVVAAAKWMGAGKTRRPILPNQPYLPPPFEPRPPLLDAKPGDDLRDFEGASPLVQRLIAATSLEDVQARWRERAFQPVYCAGVGAYPLSLAALGVAEVPRESISQALEQHFEEATQRRSIDQRRQGLLTQLRRVALAREVALASLEEAADAANRAGQLQERGQIILAYASSIPEGASEAQVWDFVGNPLTVRLDPELTAAENANKLFDKAKRAKGGAAMVAEQRVRLGQDLAALQTAIKKVEDAERLSDLEDIANEAEKRRWLHHQPLPTTVKSERPYQGHAIRELVAPGGWKVLYGENAESNDYLTLRLGKPNDWWLHVRGGVSAHVILFTQNQPEKVSRDALLFAAKIAVRNSPSKHSGYVPVDYCLKKYVRRPKGAPHGTVTYTHEKTLHVEND